MGDRRLFIALIVIGVVIALLSLFAHPLGLGHAGFGPKKIGGTIFGIIVLLIGIWGLRRQPSGLTAR